MSNRSQTIELLRKRLEEFQSDCHSLGEKVSTGSLDLDALVGTGGLVRGSLVEWIGSTGSGATTLALLAAKNACQTNQIFVVVDHKKLFYPPAVHALGIDLTRTIVIRPKNTQDYQWSLNQVFRSTGIAAVLCWPEKASEKSLRRWQLAAEQGKTLGLLVRPSAALKEPTWAKLRLHIEAQNSQERARRWRITVLGSLNYRSIELEMNDETIRLQKARPLPLASSLAITASLQRSTGA